MFILKTLENLKEIIEREIEIVQSGMTRTKRDKDYNRALTVGLKKALFYIEEYEKQRQD